MINVFETSGYYIYDGERDAENVYFVDEDGRTCGADFFIERGCTLYAPSVDFIPVGKLSIVFYQ